jgi:hypothetical protein
MYICIGRIFTAAKTNPENPGIQEFSKYIFQKKPGIYQIYFINLNIFSKKSQEFTKCIS